MQAYESHLSFLSNRVMKEGGSLELFWEQWATIFKQETINYPRRDLDHTQFRAELKLFLKYCRSIIQLNFKQLTFFPGPEEVFCGRDPSLSYERQLYNIYQKSIKDGVGPLAFWEVWNKARETKFGPNLNDNELCYLSERWAWRKLC
jgi:hypothetical protein